MDIFIFTYIYNADNLLEFAGHATRVCINDQIDFAAKFLDLIFIGITDNFVIQFMLLFIAIFISRQNAFHARTSEKLR